MSNSPLNLILADDDPDDCSFFKEALEELPLSAKLTTVNDGVQLMQLLTEEQDKLPDVLFLDLNMPRKNGFDCLSEIKNSQKLKQLPVIIFSTSMNVEMVNRLHGIGAHYYIRKPPEFSNLKKIIHRSISLITGQGNHQPLKEEFVLTPA